MTKRFKGIISRVPPVSFSLLSEEPSYYQTDSNNGRHQQLHPRNAQARQRHVVRPQLVELGGLGNAAPSH